MKRRVIISCVALVVMAAIAGFMATGGDSRSVRTMLVLSECRNVIDALARPGNGVLDSIPKALNKTTDSAGLVKRLRGNLLGVSLSSGSTNNSSQLVDAWGNPINLLRVESGPNWPLIDEMKAAPYAIWSNGMNGSNEFGFGDDIFVVPAQLK